MPLRTMLKNSWNVLYTRSMTIKMGVSGAFRQQQFVIVI